MKHPRVDPLALAATLAVLPACATYALAQPTEPPIAAFGPATSKVATVCVIRPSHWALGSTYLVRDDAQLVGATKGESYFCYYAEPGAHRLTAARLDVSDDLGQIGLHAEAGHRYWLHVDYDRELGTQLQWIEEDEARPLVERCDYKELVGESAGEPAPEGIPYARSRAGAYAP
jgi:hypothetical protein